VEVSHGNGQGSAGPIRVPTAGSGKAEGGYTGEACQNRNCGEGVRGAANHKAEPRKAADRGVREVTKTCVGGSGPEEAIGPLEALR
jgi:hypothetical protein